MSTRLTKALREHIVAAVYKASDLPARLAEMHKLAKVNAVKCVQAALPEGFAEITKNLPKEWFPQENSIYIRGWNTKNGNKISTDDIGDLSGTRISFDDPVVIPRNGMGDYEQLFYAWLTGHYRPLFQVWEADRLALHNSTASLLLSFRTVEKLLEAAPEMKQFIPKTSAAYPVPMVPISDVISTFLQRGIKLEAQPA